MQISGASSSVLPEDRPALAPGLDTSTIINRIASIREARALPVGSIVGDLHGGLTFSDAIASALESRSRSGWREVHIPTGETWTLIRLDQ